MKKGNRTRMTKNEKRRRTFEKRNVKQETRIVRYGSASGVDYAVARGTDLNRRFIAAFLALVFAISCMVVGVNFATKAADEDGFTMLTSTEDNGIVLRKGLKKNGDDSYDLKMETYATGTTVTQTLEEDVPLDVVLVIDQSGSMLTPDMGGGSTRLDAMKSAVNEFVQTIGDRAAEKDVDHRVAVVGFAGNEVPSTSAYSNNGQTVTIPYSHILGNSRYITQNTGLFVNQSFKNYITPKLTTGSSGLGTAIGYNTPLYENITYFYRYNNNAMYPLLYSPSGDYWFDVYSSSDGTLQTSQVSDLDSGNIVDWYNGSAYPSDEDLVYYPAITELQAADYQAALVDITANDTNNDKVNDDIKWAADHLDAYGGTYVSYGMAMANNVFKYNSNIVDGKERKRVVVVFTDGSPGGSGYEEAIANEAKAAASVAKDTYGATVYTVGLYPNNPDSTSEAFLHELSSEYFATTTNVNGSVAENNHSTTYYFDDTNGLTHSVTWLRNSSGGSYTYPLWTNEQVGNRTIPVTNHFDGDQRQSEWIDSNGWLRGAKWNANDTRTGEDDNIWQFYSVNDSSRQSGTYAYTASDASELSDIFTSISNSVQTPTTTASLNGDAVLKDIITDNFDNTNATVSIQTVSGTYNENTDPTWGSTTSTSGDVSYSWSGKTLNVTGFDYSDTFIADQHAGEKLVVTISGLTKNPNAQAESDNRIYSNAPDSGVYKNAEETEPFGTLPRPSIDAPSSLVPSGTTGEKDPISGLVVNKYLTTNENGMYDLTMEAYSTASTTTFAEKIPTDFVVVVDQSGSMDTDDMPTGTPRSASGNIETIANSSTGYYYYDATTDNYYRVYGVKDYLYRYYEPNYWFTGDIVEHFGTSIGWFMGETEATTNLDNMFYFRETVGSNVYYQPITTTIQGKIGTYYMKFHFDSKQTNNEYWFDREVTTYSSNGNSPWYKNVLNGDVMTSGALWSTANAAVQTLYPDDQAYTYSTINLLLARPRTGMYINYPMYERHVGYTKLCYRDINGVEHTLSASNGSSEWEFCNANGEAITTNSGSTRPNYTGLYTFPSNTTRIAALKGALTEFADAVASETDSFGAVDNKISIVGFSSSGYNNTELLTGENVTISNRNGVQKSTADNNVSYYYGSALVNSTNGTVGTVNSKITAAINAISANGGTQPEDGLDMAYKVLSNRSSTEYTIRSGENKGTAIPRNKIVIYFTDGQPGNYPYSDQYSEANEVVEAAKPIKDYGASLFSIGVFGESDGNPLTYSHANASSEDLSWKYLGGWMENYYSGGRYYCLRRQWRDGATGYTANANDTIFDYMSVTSSNYPDATDYIAPEWLAGNFNGDYTAATDGDTVRHKSTAEATNKYYRMASNQDTLVSAFMQAVTMMNDEISGDISLGSDAILQDILANGKFTLSNDSSIRCDTVKGTANSGGTITFDETTRENVTSTLLPTLGDDQIEVTSFNYTQNTIYYGKPANTDAGLEAHQGKKLIVTLTNVYPTGTVTSAAGTLYSNENTSGIVKEDELVMAFPQPSITRHSYSIDVQEANPNAVFDVTTQLVGGTASLADVILVKPDGTRVNYTSATAVTFQMDNNSNAFYFENVPSGYQIKTSVTAPDSDYTYQMWKNNETGNKVELNTTTATDSSFEYSDNVLHVEAIPNLRTVTISETVEGDYASESDTFDVQLTLTPPAGTTLTENTISIANGVTLTKNGAGTAYVGTIEDIPGNGVEQRFDSVPYNWTLKVEPVANDRYTVDEGYPAYTTTESQSQTAYPSAGLVITSAQTDIVIHNVADDITITGFADNANQISKVLYVLAAALATVGAGAAVYGYKRKKE